MQRKPISLWSTAVIALALLAGGRAFAAAPAGSWWDTSYGHRSAVSIDTGSSALPTGYSISVDINHASLVAAGRSQSDGDDVRIAYWNGGAWSELDRVLDVQSAWNGAATRIWFRTQAPIAANAITDNYYIYYGDSSAAAPPQNADNVFLLYDGFDASSLSNARWSSFGAASVSSGALTLSPDALVESQSSFGVDTVWEARVRMPSTLPNGGSQAYYYWLGAVDGATLTTGAAAGFFATANDHYVVTRAASTTQTNVADGTPTNFQTYTFFRNGAASIRYWINSGSVTTLTSNVSNTSFRAVMFNDANGSSRTQVYDWVRVRRYVSVQPTIAQASAEQYARIALWRMEQTTWNGTAGEALNSESNSLHLTAIRSGGSGAATAVTTPARPGNPGSCRYGVFDGVNDYLQVADNAALEPDTRLTVAVWVYPRSYGSELKTIVSKDTTYEFHLNSSGHVNWWWGGGARELTSSAPVPLNQWTHIAITYQPGEQRIYINGVQQASKSETGTLDLNNLPLQIGQDQGFSTRFWNGYIDEVALYNRALSASEVATLRNATYPCAAAAPPRFVIVHDNYGIHCLAETITIHARDSANNPLTTYAQTVTLTTNQSSGAWTRLVGSGAFNDGAANDGVATYQWPSGESSATFGLYYPSGPAVIDVDVFQTNNTTIQDDDLEGALAFAPSGFTVTSTALPDPFTGAVPAVVSPQTAGAAFPLHIAAYGTTPNDPTCGVIETYAGTKPLKFWSSYDNPATGSVRATIDGAAIATALNSASAQNVAFTNGRASVSAKYKDVGRLSISLRDDTVAPAAISGGTGAIVVKPASFELSISGTHNGVSVANPQAMNANGGRFIAAGAPFSVTVTSRDAEGAATPNFGRETPRESVSFASALVAPVLGSAGTLATVSALNLFNNGSATGSFAWNEVGVISLTPGIADGDYLGAGAVTSAAVNVGRFVPSYLHVTTNAARFGAACGAFTYVGQRFTYATPLQLIVEGRSISGATTTNYSGDFFKITNASLSNRDYQDATYTLNQTGLPSSTTDPAIATTARTLTFDLGSGLRFDRAGAIAPFDARITLSIDVVDSDGVAYPGATYVAGTPAGIPFSDPLGGNAPQQRYGRMAFRNAVGSELIDLQVRLRSEYFYSEAAGFVANTADSCTLLAPTPPATTPLRFLSGGGNLAPNETCVLDNGNPGNSGLGCASAAASPFSNPAVGGDFNLWLRAPGAGNDGTIMLEAQAPDWLQYDWDASDAAFENPSGIATFGIFQGSGRRIYQRERVR